MDIYLYQLKIQKIRFFVLFLFFLNRVHSDCQTKLLSNDTKSWNQHCALPQTTNQCTKQGILFSQHHTTHGIYKFGKIAVNSFPISNSHYPEFLFFSNCFWTFLCFTFSIYLCQKNFLWKSLYHFYHNVLLFNFT